jgi:lysophospholipid acyltransferase (LPLAT)-like uncharacterized protein
MDNTVSESIRHAEAIKKALEQGGQIISKRDQPFGTITVDGVVTMARYIEREIDRAVCAALVEERDRVALDEANAPRTEGPFS